MRRFAWDRCSYCVAKDEDMVPTFLIGVFWLFLASLAVWLSTR